VTKKLLVLFSLVFFNFRISAMEMIGDHQLRRLNEKQFKTIKSIAKSDLIVLIAYGNECPILRKFVPAINNMFAHYDAKKVSFFLINTISSSGDADKTINAELKKFKLKAPVFLDDKNPLLKELGFSTFSESAVINLTTNEVIYKGAINNQFTFDLTRDVPTENYLIDAIEHGLAHTKPKVSQAKAIGCEITF
jgi:hypothetical protein